MTDMKTQQQLVRSIHASPVQAVLYVAGGGAQSLGNLLSVEGASGTILEVVVPYAMQSQNELLGSAPEKYVCFETARDLARVAYFRALHLTSSGIPVIGLAVEGNLISGRLKKGDHRCIVVTYSAEQVVEYNLSLSKGDRDRPGEDHVASQLVLQALADACQVSVSLMDAELLKPGAGPALEGEGDELEIRHLPHKDPIDALLAGEERLVHLAVLGQAVRGATRARVVLPGSFNPLHEGHTSMLASAAKLRPGREAAMELSVTNADKGCLPREQIMARVQQFTTLEEGSPGLICTDAPLYVDKARLLHNTTFVIGMDTAKRLLMPKYYNNSRDEMVAAMCEIKALGCDFLVAGRVGGEGQFEELEQLEVPGGLEGLFEPLKGFRVDISSTEIRQRKMKQNELAPAKH